MATIEVIFDENGAERVVSATKEVDSSVSKLKNKLKTPLGVEFDVNAFTTKSKTITDSFQHMGIEYDKVKAKMKSPLGTGDSMLSASNFSAARKEIGNLGTEIEKTTEKSKNFGVHLGFLGRLIVAMGVRKIVHDIVDLTDAYGSFENKLRVVVPTQERLKIATADLVKIATDSRTPLEETGILFSRITQATAALGKTQTQVTQFTGTMTKAIQVSGATSTESKNAIVQLSQGMALGTLRGQDLKSVLEFLPYVSQLIADKMGVAVGQLKALGAQGKITTDTVFEGIIESTAKVEEKFAKLRPRVSEMVEVLKTKYTVALGEAGTVQDLMVGSLKFIADNFDVCIRAAVAFTAAMTLLWFGNAMQGFIAFVATNPFVLVIAGLAAATVALVTFGDKIHIPGDELLSLQDIALGAAGKMKDSFGDMISLLSNVASSFSDMWGAAAGKSKGTDWTMEVAKAIDLLRVLANPEWLVMEPLAGVGALGKDLGGQVLKDVNATQIALNEIRKAKTEQNSVDSTAKINDELARWRMGMQDANAKGIPAPPPKGKKEAGSTFSELIKEATFKADIADDDDSLTRQIETKLHTALEKLKPSIKKWGFDLKKELDKASAVYNKSVNNNIEDYDPESKNSLDAMVGLNNTALDQFNAKKALLQKQSAEYEKQVGLLREQIALAALHEATRKKQLEDEKAGEKLLEANLKKMLAEEATQRRINREKQQFLTNKVQENEGRHLETANELNPDMATNVQIQKLREFADVYKDFPEWADLAKKKAQELQLALTLGGANLIFMEQFKGTWGPGGTMVTGFSDIAARVLTFNLSLRETKSLFRDLATTLEQQALSSLFQFGINAGMGALTNAISPSPTSLPGGLRGPDGKPTQINVGSTVTAPARRFASGGYTGNYGTSQEAGIVHGQEFVLNSQATSKYRPMLEAMNKGGNISSGAPATAQVTVHNYTGVQVETGVSQNEVQIMISKGIRDQAPGVMAQHISNPNSQISRSLSKNLVAERRRT